MSRLPVDRRAIATVGAATLATLLGIVLVWAAVAHRDGAVYPVRGRLEQITAGRSLWLGALAVVLGCLLLVRARLGIGDSSITRLRATVGRVGAIRIGPAITLPVIVACSASLWVVLSAETTIPRVLADELIYSGIGKSLAEHGSFLLRGDPDTGHSLLYPLLLSPAYAFTRNGVDAHIAVQALDAIVFSLAAVPAYFLARRVVSHGLATLVAALAVFNPWGGFSAWVMTESAFYLAFVTFALAVVLVLERPTVARQLVVVGLIVVLASIRTQAAVLPAAVATAALIAGLSKREVAATLRSLRLLLGLLAVMLAVGVLALVAGSFSAYDVLFDSAVSPTALVRWGAWNAGAFALSAGVAAVVTLPAALTILLGRTASTAERATGATTAALSVALITSVALLSASDFGLGYLQERSVFYVAPLIFTCFACWLRDGARRRWRLTAITAVVVLGLAAWLPSPAPGGWTAQAALSVLGTPLGAAAAVVIVVVGALIVLLSRSAVGPVMLTVVVLATIVAVDQTTWNSPVAPSESKALAWIDDALPNGAEATIVHVDTRVAVGDTCAEAAKADQQFFVVLSEFLNTHVHQTTYLYHPVERDFLGARKLVLGPNLTLLDRGEPLRTRYVVVDSRIPISGRAIARLDLANVSADLAKGASLTLWDATLPVRLDVQGPLRLTPRPDGRACA